MAAIPWKNAASLIVLARNRFSQNGQNHQFSKYQYDYSCMLLKRSAKSKFFAKAFVFPGGATEPADFDSKWIHHFNQNGFSREQLLSQFVVPNKSRLPLYMDAVQANNDCIPEVGYRISAIRETFEETGVLFCKTPSSTDISSINNLREWQERVHRNPDEFLRLCEEHKIFPDIWSLYEWSDWLTPEHMGPKRYDTIFYISVLEAIPDVKIDGKEITEVRWSDPTSAISEHVQGNIWLAPPQIYELCRLAHFETSKDIKSFASTRQLSGICRWLPVGKTSKGLMMTVLPGDALHPTSDTQTSAYENEREEPSPDKNDKNRMEFSSPVVCRIICNIDDPHGHRKPMNLVDLITEEMKTSPKL